MSNSTLNIKRAVACVFLAGGLAVVLAAVSARAGSAPRGAGFRPRIPRGIPQRLWDARIPADNPMTAEKVALGEALYFDARLSADGAVSCATCHDPATAFADRNLRAVGSLGRRGTRNVPTVLNSMFNENQFWDGRVRTLEEQARLPLVNRDEMGMSSFDAVVARVGADGEYRRRFARVFGGGGVSIDNIARAIAAYERTRLSGDSPFDRFMGGDARAVSEAQRRGWELFRGKARCINCHVYRAASPFFSDQRFYNTGVGAATHDLGGLARGLPDDAGAALNALTHTDGLSELGRYLITRRPADLGAFRTPTLRDVELTPPYMHDGSEKTLLDVVRFYNRGGNHNPNLSEQIRPLGLTDSEASDLVEFLRALTSDEVLRAVQSATPQPRR